MRFMDWLGSIGSNPNKYAKRIKVPAKTAYRWANGERIPDPAWMRRIAEDSGLLCTADDFYGIPRPAKAGRRRAS
jgi:hypothetical protein